MPFADGCRYVQGKMATAMKLNNAAHTTACCGRNTGRYHGCDRIGGIVKAVHEIERQRQPTRRNSTPGSYAFRSWLASGVFEHDGFELVRHRHATVGYRFQQFMTAFSLISSRVSCSSRNRREMAPRITRSPSPSSLSIFAGAQDVLRMFARRFQQADTVAHTIHRRDIDFQPLQHVRRGFAYIVHGEGLPGCGSHRRCHPSN